MNALLAAQLLLLLGAALCLMPARNGFRAAVGLLSQAGATALVLSAALPIVAGGRAAGGRAGLGLSRWARCASGSTRWARSSWPGRCR
jgi:hypothetical protein